MTEPAPSQPAHRSLIIWVMAISGLIAYPLSYFLFSTYQVQPKVALRWMPEALPIGAWVPMAWIEARCRGRSMLIWAGKHNGSEPIVVH